MAEEINRDYFFLSTHQNTESVKMNSMSSSIAADHKRNMPILPCFKILSRGRSPILKKFLKNLKKLVFPLPVISCLKILKINPQYSLGINLILNFSFLYLPLDKKFQSDIFKRVGIIASKPYTRRNFSHFQNTLLGVHHHFWKFFSGTTSFPL